MSDPWLGLTMLGLIVVAIMMGFPTAFTLMGLGMVFGYIAFWTPGHHWWDNRIFDLVVQRTRCRSHRGVTKKRHEQSGKIAPRFEVACLGYAPDFVAERGTAWVEQRLDLLGTPCSSRSGACRPHWR